MLLLLDLFDDVLIVDYECARTFLQSPVIFVDVNFSFGASSSLAPSPSFSWPFEFHAAKWRLQIYPRDVEIVRIFISPSRGVRSIVMSLSVCLSVRSYILETTRPNFTKFLCLLTMAVARFFSGPRCNTTRTSGSVDDVMCSRSWPYGASCDFLCGERIA